ncbi:MAG: hypothetical protein DRP06_01055 [Candidatus Aenigmatarchaeota archaeon]|nr:MAG: hypothetical protein DRP06_01055 [Candidatus Aenigmarchaeota archaeon]
MEYLDVVDKIPGFGCIQAQGVSPIVDSINNNTDSKKEEKTIAGGIDIKSPLNGPRAIKCINKTKGLVAAITETEILDAQRDLARLEGIGAEPTGAVPIAGIRKLAEEGKIDCDECIVCMITGHVLKDPSAILNRYDTSENIEANLTSVLNALKVK